MWFYLSQGFVLGAYAAIMPGPTQAFILTKTLQNGWKKTLPMAMVPLVTDLPIALVLCLLVAQISSGILNGLRLAGGIFLIYLAYGVFTSMKRQEVFTVREGQEAQRGNFIKAALTNFTNPNVYIFWGSIGAPIVISGWRESPWLGAGFIGAMYAALIGGIALTILLFGLSGSLPPKWRQWIGYAMGSLIIGFGLNQIYQGVAYWISNA
ncbi:MAG: LysE family translocator [Anaerolineaceae bacterium]|nr:LysE family translocator [Anaerolineaceae bacterium]